MSSESPLSLNAEEHAGLAELLPWYVNGTLPAAEAERIAQHLSECAACREDAAALLLAAGPKASPGPGWKPSPTHFAAILEQVDALEEAAPDQRPTPRAEKGPGLWRRIGAWLGATPNPIRWTLAAETLALATLAAVTVISVRGASGGAATFQTLSDSPTAPVAEQTIRLVFAPEITAGEMTTLLTQVKAQLRKGPTAVGAFSVAVPNGEESRALAVLRAHSKVKLAERIDVAGNAR